MGFDPVAAYVAWHRHFAYSGGNGGPGTIYVAPSELPRGRPGRSFRAWNEALAFPASPSGRVAADLLHLQPQHRACALNLRPNRAFVKQ